MKNLLINSTLIGIILLPVFLGGCIAEETVLDKQDRDEQRGIFLTFGQASTRNTDAPIPGGTSVTFNTGDLYLVSDIGAILNHFTIVNRTSDIDTDLSANVINRGDLDNVFFIPEARGNLAEIVIVGNTDENPSVNLPTSGMISSVGTQIIDILSQHNVHNVNIFGSGKLVPTNTTTAAGFELFHCHVRLVPTVARFEIADIMAVGEVESFVVEGIFIDNYFHQARINGEILTTAGNLVSNGSDSNKFVGGSSTYPTTHTPALYDWYRENGGLASKPTDNSFGTFPMVSPGTRSQNVNNITVDDVWSYQLFAQNYDTKLSSTPFPTIIIRLNNIKLKDDTLVVGARFITIAKFTTSDGTDGMHAGRVYRIPPGKLVFDERHITEEPNKEGNALKLEAVLASWDENLTTPPPVFRQPDPEDITICPGTQHTFTLASAVGSPWAFSYRWEMSTDGDDWTAAGEGINHTTSLLSVDTWFRRVAIDAVHGSEITSEPALVSMPVRIEKFPEWILIDGVRWSTRNVDYSNSNGFVAHPADRGMMFQWSSNVGWSSTNPLRGWYPGASNWASTLPTWVTTGANLSDNPWNNNQGPCPSNWRLPTNTQLQSLVDNVRSLWITQDQAMEAGLGCQAGRIFGTNNVAAFDPALHIFFPAVGLRNFSDAALHNVGTSGVYRSSAVSSQTNAWVMNFTDEGFGVNSFSRAQGFSVRCIVR
jgi:uncharacterized protein (TIGR02145 family)